MRLSIVNQGLSLEWLLEQPESVIRRLSAFTREINEEFKGDSDG